MNPTGVTPVAAAMTSRVRAMSWRSVCRSWKRSFASQRHPWTAGSCARNCRTRELGDALHGATAHHHGDRDGVAIEGVEEAPEADPHAEAEYLLLHQVAHAGRRARGYLAQSLGRVVPLLDRELGTLLEVQDQ
jgi:hypothetical protein